MNKKIVIYYYNQSHFDFKYHKKNTKLLLTYYSK